MNIERKIQKRIATIRMLKCANIDEIQITKEEAEQLGDRRVLDGVKLVVVEKIGNKTKKDCFAYKERNKHASCYCLNKLYCKNRKCKFYRTDININDIEKSIELYEMKK